MAPQQTVRPDAPDPLHAGSFRLRPLQRDDLEQVRSWRNDPVIRSQMRTRHQISLEEHRRWFDRLGQRGDQAQWLILYRNTAVGVSSLHAAEAQKWESAAELESGLYLGDASLRGSLLAFVPAMLTLRYCFDHLQTLRVRAEVAASNLAAIRFNQRLGYVALGADASPLKPALTGSMQPWVQMAVDGPGFHRATATMERLYQF